jgi:hypothetical protein
MHKIKTKGVSNVLATLLITLLSILAVSLLAVAVNNVVYQARFSPKFTCAEVEIASPIQIQKACYNVAEKELEITLKRSIDNLDMDIIDFSLSGIESSDWCCGSNCNKCNIPEQAETKTYYFPVEQKPDFISISSYSCPIVGSEIENC